jgi:cytochrome c553
MNRLRIGFLLGIVALLALTFLGTSVHADDPSHEPEPELVIPPGGGVVPPPEVQIQVVEVEVPAPAGSPIHPSFALLVENGRNVLDTGGAVSTLTTCGTCHGTAFIADHSYHASVGLTAFTDPGDTASGRPWDTSNGLFGRRNPITYRYLSPSGDDLIDLGTADWISTIGTRHAGSGPAATSRSGYPLSELAYPTAIPRRTRAPHFRRRQ